MSVLNVIFIIPTELTTNPNTLSISLLKEKGIAFSVYPYDDKCSGVLYDFFCLMCSYL